MPVYSISHLTTYRYARLVGLSHQALWLEPLTTETQECLHFALEVTPTPVAFARREDYFGNQVHYATITEPHGQLGIHATSKVTVTPVPVSLFADSMGCGELRGWLESAGPAAHQARQFLYASPRVPRLPAVAEFAAPFFGDEQPVLEGVLEWCAAVHRDFVFDSTATTHATPLETFFRQRRGVCQDFAHLAVASLRSAGLAVRYVSGYLLTDPPPGRPRLVGADASHAWASVYVPDAGWVDFDPTNNVLCSERHITVARGRDYSDVSPVRGTVRGGGKQTLRLGVTVSPAGE
jgi:transglutaminase-like putative cysteine protease